MYATTAAAAAKATMSCWDVLGGHPSHPDLTERWCPFTAVRLVELNGIGGPSLAGARESPIYSSPMVVFSIFWPARCLLDMRPLYEDKMRKEAK